MELLEPSRETCLTVTLLRRKKKLSAFSAHDIGLVRSRVKFILQIYFILKFIFCELMFYVHTCILPEMPTSEACSQYSQVELVRPVNEISDLRCSIGDPSFVPRSVPIVIFLHGTNTRRVLRKWRGQPRGYSYWILQSVEKTRLSRVGSKAVKV